MDLIRNHEEIEVLIVGAERVDGVRGTLVDKYLVIAGGLQNRASLAERVSASERPQRVDYVLNKLTSQRVAGLEPSERIAALVAIGSGDDAVTQGGNRVRFHRLGRRCVGRARGRLRTITVGSPPPGFRGAGGARLLGAL